MSIQRNYCILSLLSQLKPDRVDERSIYDAIIGWVKHNESRKDDFAELFQRLNLNKLSSSFLAEKVSTETLVIENHLCSNLVMTTFAMKFQDRVFSIPSKILSLGGLETRSKVFVVYNNDQTVYPLLPQASFGQCSLKVNDFVCILKGGILDSRTNKVKVWKMNLYKPNLQWEEVASMEVDTIFFSAAVYENGIAISGGWSSNDVVKSAEFYNSSLNRWSALPSMKEGRYNHRLVTCNDCLFCLGGRNKKCLSSVEMLSDVNETWQHIQPMQTPRSNFAAVNCMDAIYAIGGYNKQDDSIKSVEKYDSKSNKWIYVQHMNIERCGHSACAMWDKIFVVGGKNAKNEFVFEIECYDPSSDNWSIVGNTQEKLARHSVVAI